MPRVLGRTGADSHFFWPGTEREWEQWLESVDSEIEAIDAHLRDVLEEFERNDVSVSFSKDGRCRFKSESHSRILLEAAFELGRLSEVARKLQALRQEKALRAERARKNPSRKKREEDRSVEILRDYKEWCRTSETGAPVSRFLEWFSEKRGTPEGFSESKLRRAVKQFEERVSGHGSVLAGRRKCYSLAKSDEIVKAVLLKYRRDPGVSEVTIRRALVRQGVISG